MWSVKCEVWGLECEGSSEKWEVWSVKCGVWSLKFGVRRVQCAVWGVECRGKDTVGTGCLWTIGHLCLGNFRRRLARVYVTIGYHSSNKYFSKMKMCEQTPFWIHGQKSTSIYFTRDKYVISLAPAKKNPQYVNSMQHCLLAELGIDQLGLRFGMRLNSLGAIPMDSHHKMITWVYFKWPNWICIPNDN